MKKKNIQRKRRNRISLKTDQDKEIKRPTHIGRKGVGFLLTEDAVQTGSPVHREEGDIKHTSHMSNEAPRELSQHK